MMPTGFDCFEDLLSHCAEKNCSVGQAALALEARRSGREPEAVLADIRQLLAQMRATIESGLASDEKSLSGLSGGDAKRLMAFASSNNADHNPNNNPAVWSTMAMRLMAYGLATLEENSRMKRIVACPTAGGSGSVPAVLIALEHEQKIDPEQSVWGLLTAGLIGEIVSRRMFLSGAAAGCQAEVGVASGMAAGAAVQVWHGSPEQVCHAAALSMQNLLGLVCDPVAGLVEVPCVARNGLSGVQALSAATMAMAGIKSFIPLDEVVDAMAEVGRLMPAKLKETAEGGLAQTQTAKTFTQQFYGLNKPKA